LSEHCRPPHLTTVIHSFLLNTSWIGFNGSQSVTTRIGIHNSDLGPVICQKRSIHQLFKCRLKSYFNNFLSPNLCH